VPCRHTNTHATMDGDSLVERSCIVPMGGGLNRPFGLAVPKCFLSSNSKKMAAPRQHRQANLGGNNGPKCKDSIERVKVK
jgi:hypothetical protein